MATRSTADGQQTSPAGGREAASDSGVPQAQRASHNGSSPRNSAPAVRFSSAVQEISPQEPAAATVPTGPNHVSSPVTADQLQAFTKSLHGRPLQERRMNTFQFEAFSLPPSRVPSHEDDSPDSTRHPTPSSSRLHSPHGSPRLSSLASPPLTPAGSDPSNQGEKHHRRASGDRSALVNEPSAITPQSTSSHEKSQRSDRIPLPQRPVSSDQVMVRSSSAEGHKGHRQGMFSVGPGSVPVSREQSPSRASASQLFSRPVIPGADANDPYAKGRRPPPQQNVNRRSIDARFLFSRKKGHGSSCGSKSTQTEQKRSSGFFGSKSGNESADVGSVHNGSQQGSMADLKRFFRKSDKKRDSSPASSKATSSRLSAQLPFGEEHGLTSKYGKLGRVLGQGAGGSVRVMKRKEDGTIFAVKEFRARYNHEAERDYNKKVTAEFCIGSTLHHGNIIETLDIFREKGRWFEVMEFAPYDLFACVMSGRMTREEVKCCFLQILNGVTYLHSVGLAHRDLKLDNVVVSDRGIMKIIDFGSAHVFKYPFEASIDPAQGVVGSDPYLAPEVYESMLYEAQAVDIWSLAIIFCCMTLRRFPWKKPRQTDNSFKLFCAKPTPEYDPRRLFNMDRGESPSGPSSAASEHAPSSTVAESVPQTPTSTAAPSDNTSMTTPINDSASTLAAPRNDHVSTPTAPQGDSSTQNKERKDIILGPWRVLRLLPRETRYIIYRMLDINPKTRATMAEIVAEPWVADTVICQQMEDGEVLSASDHGHVLEPPASPGKKSN
ncbi:hypothetical protein CDD81_6799 [Ophiocordyceps australis]|uniref:non-specific serine/threonine protein kinase n=1 Tax=Ophiocordyceps australis TaxID=1399860 RepID=A0A2C5Y4T2_9HYPO|nr:hypothetical protein CDD81_6799 [Ophiocordyceps australis]